MIRKAIYTSEDEEFLTKKGHEWNFHEADTQEHLHSLHPYPAKFIPQIPRQAILRWSKLGELVYDPFCGCGTTLLEASLSGRNAIGTDNNAIAILASKAKTANYKNPDLISMQKFVANLTTELANAPKRPDLIPDNKNFLYWFDSQILENLAALKGLILEFKEPLCSLLLAIFSSIIVRVSYQDSDTRYARIKREVTPGDVLKAFKSKLLEVLKNLPSTMIPGRGEVNVFQADARDVPFIRSGSVSLIVTSPPYLNAYDYHKYHRQRIHWVGGSVELARNLEIGSHDEFTRNNAKPDGYFSDMAACFAEWSRVLKKGGRCLMIIGDSIVNKQPVFVGDKFVELLDQYDMFCEERCIRTLHATKRAFNVRSSRISHEHVLLFQKR